MVWFQWRRFTATLKMPYDDFPIDIQGEGPSLDAASILQSQHSADWAKKFPNNNNLMTRKRHQADVAENLATQQAAQEAYQNDEIRTNKLAQDFFFRSKKLDMDRELGKATLNLREQTFNHKVQMQPMELEARRAATNAALAREKSTLAATALKAQLEKEKDEHTAGFVEHMKSSAATRGTKAFEDAAVEGRLKFSGMDHVLFQDVVKSHGSGIDPDEALKLRQTALTAAPGATVTTRLEGGVTMTDRPVAASASKEKALLSARLSRLEALRGKSGLDKDQKLYYDEEIRAAKQQLTGSTEKPYAPPSTTAEMAPTSPDLATVKSPEDFAALPSGTLFVDPNGVKRRKP